MHIEKITYSGVMPLAPYGVNDKMDVSVLIKEGENSMEAANLADQFITQFFKQKYPTLKRPTGTIETKEHNTLETAQVIGKNETPIESFKRQVDQCKSITELNGWDLFVSGKGKEEYKKYLETAKLKYK